MEAWESFLAHLEKKMGKATIDQWLRPLKIVTFDACNLYLEAQHSFQIAWFDEHIKQIAKTSFVNNNGHAIKIHFQDSNRRKSVRKVEHTPRIPPLEIQSTPLDQNQTFSNFLYDEENQLSVELCKRISLGSFNPLFLFGGHGSGKTHLLHACGKKLQNAGYRVFFVHSETFTEHVVKAIRSSEMQQFRSIYRNQDVLIIDDIHCLANRLATQEELFHTFNTLHTSGKQLIFSSNIPPGKLEGIEPRLTSRFEWGIVLEIHTLSKKLFRQVLMNKARLHHFPLEEGVLSFLIETFSTSNSSAMRALEALLLRCRGEDPISLAGAKALLQDLLNDEDDEQNTPDKILTATAAYFGVHPGDILGKSQSRECTLPRKLAMYLCRTTLDLPYAMIGKIFERDHSTVMAGIQSINKEKGTEEISAAIDEISKYIGKIKS